MLLTYYLTSIKLPAASALFQEAEMPVSQNQKSVEKVGVWESGVTGLHGPNPGQSPISESELADWKRLSVYLRSQGMTFEADQLVRKFAGGLANRNYLVVVDGVEAVLRRPPGGDLPPGSHDMAREHRILSNLSKVLAFIPRSLHFCDRRDVIGVPFQLIEYRPGIVVRGADLSPVDGYDEAPRMLCEMLVATLARVHQVDAQSAGLGDLGRPEGFVARAIAGWSKRGALVSGSGSVQKLLDDISEWLNRVKFQERRPTLLHCDFKLDNIVLNPTDLSPVALIDWDMGTRGDPLFDLATLLSYWVEPGDPVEWRNLGLMPTANPGFWTRSELAARYSAATGIDLDDLLPMRVLALFKLGIVFLQLHSHWVSGRIKDKRYADFAALGENLLLIARDVSTGELD